MLRGDKVRLTEVRPTDSETLFGWINDAETVRFNAPYAPVTFNSHSGWFEGIGRDPKRCVFAIRENEKPEPIGVVQLIDMHPIHRSTELIIRIGAAANRGKGLGTDALKLAVSYAFDDQNLQRVWLRVFASNARAIKAYKNAGFEEEGRMKRACFIGGKWDDELVMAILRKDL